VDRSSRNSLTPRGVIARDGAVGWAEKPVIAAVVSIVTGNDAIVVDAGAPCAGRSRRVESCDRAVRRAYKAVVDKVAVCPHTGNAGRVVDGKANRCGRAFHLEFREFGLRRQSEEHRHACDQ